MRLHLVLKIAMSVLNLHEILDPRFTVPGALLLFPATVSP